MNILNVKIKSKKFNLYNLIILIEVTKHNLTIIINNNIIYLIISKLIIISNIIIS